MDATVEDLDLNNVQDEEGFKRRGSDGDLAILYRISRLAFVEGRRVKGNPRDAFIADHVAVAIACLRAYERSKKNLKVMDYSTVVTVRAADFADIEPLA